MPRSPRRPRAPREICKLCGASGHFPDLVRVSSLRPALVAHIAETRGIQLAPDDHVCQASLKEERSSYLLDRLVTERGQLSDLERQIADQASRHAVTVANQEREWDGQRTLGQRVADQVARVGGSWPFVISFLTFISLWMVLNSLFLATRAFDPFPYILLNLVLSCLAAIQAPVIMMSQNRSAEVDRRRAEHDYHVNLKAELEVATLHEKMDHLLHAQWEELIELQQEQLEILEELRALRDKAPTKEPAH
ncbi:MAG: DUF1003 domain-containing protein [Polyangiaceae bacterium]